MLMGSNRNFVEALSLSPQREKIKNPEEEENMLRKISLIQVIGVITISMLLMVSTASAETFRGVIINLFPPGSDGLGQGAGQI